MASLPPDFALNGADANSLVRVLGEPSLARIDWPAEYRRYDLAGCSLDLYLYQGPQPGVSRVSYWEARSELPSDSDGDLCRQLSARLGAMPGNGSNRTAAN